MKKIQQQFEYTVYDKLSDLPDYAQSLMEAAIAARANAHAPYSGFHVGSAVLLENGEVVIGNNQENAAYPSGLCGERVAMFFAGAKFPNVSFKAVAITAQRIAGPKVNKPVGSCGPCRQVMLEYRNTFKQPFELYFFGEVGQIIRVADPYDLMPLSFGPDDLSGS
jgi:cytidine deaminase